MIPDVKKILFTTDLTPNSKLAFEYSVSIANKYESEVVLLHVMEDLPQSTEAMISGFIGEAKMAEQKKRAEEDARQVLIGKKKDSAMIRQALDTFCQDTKNGMDDCNFVTDIIVSHGVNVAEEIVNNSESTGCDLIIMGHHSRGALADAVFGSCVKGVLRKSRVPVLLVPIEVKK